MCSTIWCYQYCFSITCNYLVLWSVQIPNHIAGDGPGFRLAAGIKGDSPVHKIMTDMVATCSPDDDIETALLLMGREQIRRMPVCDERSRVVGIVALADLADHDLNKREVTETLSDICEPSGMHCQVPLFA